MKKLEKLLKALHQINLVFIAILPVLLAISGNVIVVNGQTPFSSLRFLQAKVYSEKLDGRYGAINAASYDANGGSIDISVSGNLPGSCPRGSESIRFKWRFIGQNVSQLTGNVVVSAEAQIGQISRIAPCTTSFVNNSDIWLAGSSGTSGQPSFTADEVRKIDGEVFYNRQRILGPGIRTLAINARNQAPLVSSMAWFEIYISTPAGPVRVVYFFEIVRGSQAGCGWKNASDPNAPGDEGRGIMNWQAHYQYANGPNRVNVAGIISNRMAILRRCLSREAYARLYASVSVRIAAVGRTYAGWIDGTDSRAGNDPGRGVSNAGAHAYYINNGTGIDTAHVFVASRLVALRDRTSFDVYARLYADLSVLIASYGDTGNGPA